MILRSVLPALALAATTNAIALDVSDPTSIKNAAATIAYRLMTNYNGNTTGNIPGLLPQDPIHYYWWETGSMFGTLVDYWTMTNDTSYNPTVKQGTLFQVGANNDFQPVNQTKDLGNDDQVFWGFTVCDMFESGFENPSADEPGWLALAQAVFNTQAAVWDTSSCGGGLRWQKFALNSGYDYKNSPSNIGFFDLAARLGLYTGNQSYLDWATKAWDWSERIGLYNNGHIYDGSDDTLNCTQINHVEWSYSSGMALHGAAVMYAATNKSSVWEGRINALWNVSSGLFFKNGIMTEYACEQNTPVNCNTDQLSFKAPYARFIAFATKYATWLVDPVYALIETSAKAAAAQCTGSPGGDSCGTVWTNNGVWDGTQGVGQQMSALSVVSMLNMKKLQVPLTNSTGGTSVGNPSAGIVDYSPVALAPITAGDRAGAGILTAIILILTLSCVWWVLHDETSSITSLPFFKK